MAQFSAIVELSALDATEGFRIDGADRDDRSGYSVSAAGDVNGDGFDDVIVGAYRAGPHGQYSGSAYVVFGKRTVPAAVQLSALTAVNGFRIDGTAIDDQLGRSVASAGDINGDSFADVIVGAPGTDSGGPYSNSGSGFVVFGRAAGFATPVKVSALNGANGFRLDGGRAVTENNDQAGRVVGSAGDVNGDGLVDLLVGAYRASPNGRLSGSTYVVFNRATGLPASLDMATLNGVTGFRLDGPVNPNPATGGYSAGYSAASAGDVNGDGFGDLIIGAPRASRNGLYTGSSYVVFGKKAGFVSAINLSTLNGFNGFRLDGPAGQTTQSGVSVESAGDINGDGFADLIIGSPLASPAGVRTGTSYVVFGKAAGFAAAINLSTLNGANGFRIDGVRTLDRAGFSVDSAGDVNGDGFDDLIVGAYNAAPNGDDSGAAYVVFGKAAGFTAALNLATLNGANGFRISGVDDYDLSGRSVAAAGDVNGDGLDDIIVGALGANLNGKYSGSSFIVYGRKPTGVVNTNGSQASQTLAGSNFADTIGGGGGSDTVRGFSGDDKLDGGTGSDAVAGDGGADSVSGGDGKDTVAGGPQDDSVGGGDGSDLMGGGNGHDAITGGSGADTIFAGSGRDTINTGVGHDSVVGGLGADTFSFTVENWGGDRILDFDDGLDLLRFNVTIADAAADFRITGNGTQFVRLAIGDQALRLQDDKPITITNEDFLFFI